MQKYQRKHTRLFYNNRKIIKATQSDCGICGRLVNQDLPASHPLSAEVDHIVPVEKGGGDGLDNLQLTHKTCNKSKGVNLYYNRKKDLRKNRVSYRNLPQECVIL